MCIINSWLATYHCELNWIPVIIFIFQGFKKDNHFSFWIHSFIRSIFFTDISSMYLRIIHSGHMAQEVHTESHLYVRRVSMIYTYTVFKQIINSLWAWRTPKDVACIINSRDFVYSLTMNVKTHFTFYHIST